MISRDLYSGSSIILNGCRKETGYHHDCERPACHAAEMGTTLPHEHFLVDFIGADSTGFHRWNKDTVISMVLPICWKPKRWVLNTIIECTPAYLGRDPVLLQQLSKASGLNIITNTGYYGAIDNKALPDHALYETADQIAERWINEWQNGIESTRYQTRVLLKLPYPVIPYFHLFMKRL